MSQGTNSLGASLSEHGLNRAFAGKMRTFRHRILVIAGLLIAVCGVFAQTDLSTIRGAVRDQSGAAPPDAKITITNTETNISREAVTTAEGVFEIPYLSPGVYRLTATGTGFKTFVADKILLTSREIRRIDVAFEIGAVNTEVTVTANAAVINTEGSQVAGGFNRTTYQDSPMSVSFFPQAFMTTLANVQVQGGGFSIRVAGQPSAQIAESLDGVPSDGPVNLVQNMNDFSELQVVGANNSAEYSRVSNFSMTGRSGSNDFHGRVFYQIVTSALNAREFFVPQKPANHAHYGGGSLSGPIRKNRTFFYGAYYLEKVPGSTFYNRAVPGDAFRGGDFSSLLTQARPVVVKDPLNGEPFAGNIIPASRFSSTALKIQNSYYPKANQSGANNYGFLFPWTSDLFKWDSTTDRVDHKFSDANTLFVRYINRITPYVLAGNFPDFGTWTRKRLHHSVVVSDTHVFSPALVNTARWGWIKDYISDGETVAGVTPVNGDAVVRNVGLQGVNPRGFSAEGAPQVDITGYTSLLVQPGGVNTAARNFDYADSMTWSRGAHVLKFGGEMRTFRTFSGTVPTGTYGQFVFNGTLTGNSYSDFLLGLPFTSARIDPLVGRAQRSYELGLFITDTWKVSPKLTLDYGLRWDYFGPSTYRDGLQYNWDLATGNVIVPPDAVSKITPLYPVSTIKVVGGQVIPTPSKHNFRPRLGVAYRLDNKTVIRGGYGMYSETLGNINNLNTSASGPFQLSETFTNQVTRGQPLFAFPNPFPSGAGAVASQSITGYPLQTTNGIVHQFNFTIEREVKDIGIRLSYIGSRSHGLHYLLPIDKPQPSLIPFTQSRRPFPQFVGVSYYQQDGNAKYDSVQIEATRKVGAFSFDAHYTLANNMADYLDLENPYNHNFWNRDQYTARNRFVSTAVYTLPFGKGRRYLAQAPKPLEFAAGGWRMMWITMFQGGQYFSPSFSGSDPSNSNTSGGLPDRISNGNYPSSQRTVTNWFSAAAFAVPAPGHFGNSGVNILEGPGIALQHMSIVKSFPIKERLRAEFQCMILDLFNTPNFSAPFSNISVPNQVAQLNALLTSGSPANATTVSNRSVLLRLRIEF
jgi:Carboxypeptidase regulatory-like domain